MLSICIPIYAYDLRPFVQELQRQAKQLPVPWEILLLDDASPPPWKEYQAELAEWEGVRYAQLTSNRGRAAIRNELARRAQYDYLLFLDGDGALEGPQFLAQYLEYLHPQQVLCGGRTYAPTPPSDPDLYLHWYYGSQREVRAAQVRQRQPYLGFMTNNFVVPTKVMRQIPFAESITTYGHEDTLFGQALREAGIDIVHLNNPVRHLGLEAGEAWLRKQKQAVDNLYRIHQNKPELDTRLLQWWHRLGQVSFLRKAALAVIGRFSPYLRRRLLAHQPPALWALDLLKIHWLSLAEKSVSGS